MTEGQAENKLAEVRDSHLEGGKVGWWTDREVRKVELGKHLEVKRIGHLEGGLDGQWTDKEVRKVELGKRKIYRRKIFWPWPSTFRLKELFFRAFSNKASTLIIIDLIYNISVD